MANYIKNLKEDNEDITYPVTKAGAVYLNSGTDLESKVGTLVSADEIAVTSPSTPLVGTNMIDDKAVTADKVDWTTMNIMEAPGKYEIVGTTTGDNLNYAIKYEDGRLVCIQKYLIASVAATSAWGGVYSRDGIMTPRNYAVEFTSIPVVSATPIASNTTGNFWLCLDGGAYGSTTAHPGAYQCVRGTSATITNARIDIVAYGFWK